MASRRGGWRPGSGRPHKEQKAESTVVRIPLELVEAVEWLKKNPAAAKYIPEILLADNGQQNDDLNDLPDDASD